MSAGIATLTKASANRKLTAEPKARPMSVTRAAQGSCPSSCPFMGNGCYAEGGPSGIHTSRVNKAAKLADAGALEIAAREAELIATEWPRDGRPLRLHEVGDCKTPEAAQLVAAGVEQAQAAGAGEAYTYTHAWRDVKRSDWGPISVLASCETEADVGAALEQGYRAARVVDTFESDRLDSRGIPCPAQTGAAPDCASCKLCFRADRLKRPILFAAHGSGARKVREVVR